MKRLMVIVPDRISDIIKKGEVVERYYNPGNLFEEVHVVMTNDDCPDPDAMRTMVGNARLFLHNLPDSRRIFAPTLGWRPWLLGPWAARAVRLAQEIRPAMIRCHGALLNAYAAACIKRTLGIPYVVSMHINPDVDVRGRARGWLKRFVTHAQRDIERIGLLNADLVMPVYRPIVPYLERIGVTRYEVCYNVLNGTHLRRKEDYRLHRPVRVLSVGRQFEDKNPDNLIRAVSQLPDVELTLVGDGPYHHYLRGLAKSCGIQDRVVFHPSLSNDELCRSLADYDIFATHTEYWEISKSVLEALLVGLPVLLNRRRGEPVPELTEDICVLVPNTVEAYVDALRRLIADDDYRERLGRRAYAHAQAHWAPEKTEAKFVSIYRAVLESASDKNRCDPARAC